MALLVTIIILALIFDFLNGFHDSANSIATVVSTKVLSPFSAVLMAALFNFIAFTIFPLKVAATIGKGVVHPEAINLVVIGAALSASIIWDILTWLLGLPSSSSHTLVGGLLGAAIAHAGPGSIIYSGVLKIIIFIVVAPFLGTTISFITTNVVMNLAKRSTPFRIDKLFRRIQIISASAVSLGHGGNDAQKSMGIIWIALITTGLVKSEHRIDLWIVLACQAAMGLGTLFGGWRIVRTMGQRIMKLKPFEGFCAETAGALTLFGATHFGIPVSTTHIITGSIIGVGLTKRLSAVKWGVTRKIFWAWMLTIPVTGLMSALFFMVLHLFLN